MESPSQVSRALKAVTAVSADELAARGMARRRRRRPPRAAFTNGVPAAGLAPGASRQTILVAEDDPVLLSGIALLLRGAGYDCMRARNGEEAVDRFRACHGQVDLLLLDVFMPGMDGVSAWRRMQRINPTVPCIIMSAIFDSELALRLNPRGFLAKPFEPADLLVSVRDVLAESS